ncbi:MAG TPA: hypothetical protein DCZ92_05860 [Elusimicrobia bacterium]|nr:MAG: hypothetical protein A2016_07065 [Elusimicrobia bacterium GWF2_62_30]HBA60330.1 hypothetical protein [Elusimicrobiota bacterium]
MRGLARLGLTPFGELPPVTRWLAASFLAGWLCYLVFGFRLTFYFGLVPFNVTGQYWLWQTVTYLFIHGGFWHFLFNALMLWMLGGMLEAEMGSRKFLLYFLVCGAAAALVTVAFAPASDALRPVVGASGAIFALLAAFAFLHPDMTVYVYFLFPMRARTMALLLGLLEFALSFSRQGSMVSNITHLGGLVAGFAWLWTERRLAAAARERVVPDPAAVEQAEIDRLLEKISKHGQASLSAAELARLDDYAKKGGHA